MSSSEVEQAALLPLLPPNRVGEVETIEAINVGLSGAGVYAVTTSRGAYVLRIQGSEVPHEAFARQLKLLHRVSEANIAPAVVHVDEAARAVVSVRVNGRPLGAVLSDPAQRQRTIAALIEQLRTLHALDPSNIAPSDPVHHARLSFEKGRLRIGFPAWALSLGPTFDALEATLSADPRRVVSHNDANPTNILWDGTRAWLVDWDIAGLNHPHYDLATLALFLRLDDETAFALAALHDGSPLDEHARATFRALRQLVGLLSGLTFLRLVDDLKVVSAPTLDEAPTLASCYERLNSGALDIQGDAGKASFGLALLALSMAP